MIIKQDLNTLLNLVQSFLIFEIIVFLTTYKANQKNVLKQMKTKTNKSPQYKFNRTLADWKKAVQLATNPVNPRYDKLQEIYRDILLDNHLHAVVQNRMSNILSSEFEILDKSGKKIDPPFWMRKVLEWLAETPIYGHTCLEWFDGDFYFIPRTHVSPSTKQIVLDTSNYKRIPLDESILLLFWKNEDLGILHKAAPSVYYKRFALSSWSEYVELFGMPVRVGKTNRADTAARDELYDELERLGRAAFAVIDTEDSIEFVETTKPDVYSVFDKLTERANSELSKLIQGQTGTTDEKSFTGSAQVHERQSNAITWNDKEQIASWMNNIIFPFLKLEQTFNWIPSDDLGVMDQWSIHKEMLEAGLPVDLDFLSEKYNTPFKQA